MNPADLLPPGIEIEDAITGLAGAAAFLTVLAVWYALLLRPVGSRRVKEMAFRREALRSGLLAPSRRSDRLVSTDFMRSVVRRLNLERGKKAESMSLRLAQAGWRSNDALVRYLFCKAVLPLVFGAGAVILLYVLDLYDLDPMVRLVATVAAVIVGGFAPEIAIKNQIDKRSAKLRKSLPDALDLMVICAEAGLSLDALMRRVSEEFARTGPELADELALTSIELGFLPDRRQALMNLSGRTALPGIRGLVNSLVQSEKYGTPLAQSLRVLSAEFREERMLKAEEKAARLPAMLTVPMILFILPPLFIVLIGPAIIITIDAMRGV